MILSVSRRTDVPALYSQWFFRRLQEGYALVRNPVVPRQVSRVGLTRDVVDGIVLWTRNPAPMLEGLEALAAYPFYFQFTLTPYGADLEPGLPGVEGRIALFRALSARVGAARVVWRYDPILLNPRYTEAFHREAFLRLSDRLAGYTERCTVSFIDAYRSTRRNAEALSLAPISPETMRALAGTLAQAAKERGIALDACAEATDLSDVGVARARCIDADRIARIGGVPLRVGRDRNQRAACGCAESIDLGAYNSCSHGCLYCYASYDAARIPGNIAAHDPASPLLIGRLSPQDSVRVRSVRSCARRGTDGFFQNG